MDLGGTPGVAAQMVLTEKREWDQEQDDVDD